jgi:hypothetical protein
MDSITDTTYSRDHEYGGSSITALKYSKENKNYDGIVADIFVQSKISEAKRQCDKAMRQVTDIKRELQEMR